MIIVAFVIIFSPMPDDNGYDDGKCTGFADVLQMLKFKGLP